MHQILKPARHPTFDEEDVRAMEREAASMERKGMFAESHEVYVVVKDGY
ncbi:MAG: hypothetical protein Q7R66_10925 [Undibacterium sp.]|nr:hypothetical protein [Undibacterium sp.]MDO8652694.1 hypothetical protein [Undibacterium sp.]